MRGLASSTCWLFIIAILAVFTSVSGAVRCDALDENGVLFKQMETCIGSQFEFKTDKEKDFDLSKLDQATADKILYEDVKGVRDPTKPKRFVGHVKIIDSVLENLVLAIDNPGGDEPVKVNIVGNMKLNNLKLDPYSGVKVSLTLKGNKHLSMQSIKKINKIGNIERGSSTIQEFQDCSFDGKLKTLDDLKECTAVEGDLIIDQDTTIPSTMPFIQIEKIKKGCLRIENSKLTSIDFLVGLLDGNSKDKCADGGQSHIKGNKQLCIPSEDWPKWNAIYPLSYAGACRDRCSLGFALANKDAATAPCDIVVGDVKITGDHRRRRQSGTPPQLAHWDRVKELEGTLEVSNTNLEDIVIFNNLEKITNPSPEKVALTVMKNPKMTKFDLPNLKNITIPSNTWSDPIFFLDNGNFSFSYDEGERWKSITGRGYLSIPIDPPPLTTAAPTTPGATTKSPEEIAAENKRNKEMNEETKRNENNMLSISYGGMAAVCVIFFIVVVGLALYYRNIKGKLAEEDHDLNSAKVALLKNLKNAQKNKLRAKKKMTNIQKDDVTVAAEAPVEQYKLALEPKRAILADAKSILERNNITRVHMTLDADEIPFKMTDVVMKIDAPEMDLARAHALLTQAPLPKMKHKGKPFRHIERFKLLFFNPLALNRQTAPIIQKYDRFVVFKYLVTHCTTFFTTNAHLLPEIIADCSGPYYTPTNSLLVEIEGPVYVIGDIHEALHVVQTVLNLDLDGEGKKHKIHPMFRNRYLFLGDYLDRGEHGIEVYFLLCLAARLYPSLFTVLRGNHDGRIPVKGEKTARLNYYGDRLKKMNPSIANPHHFAEIIVNEIQEKVTPFLPMAAIINGQTFAAHGGFTLAMALSKKSIREMFKEIPIPYYDISERRSKQYGRYLRNGELELEEKGEDQYTKKYQEMMEMLETWNTESTAYTAAQKTNQKMAPNYNFESQFPGLNTVMWSDPGHALASAGNHRLVGCTFNAELVHRMIENNKAIEKGKSIVDIIRAHQVVAFAHSCDHRVTTVFTNCDNVRELPFDPATDDGFLSTLKCSTDLLRCASVLHINEDGSRTVVFLSMTTDKKPEQALVNPNRTFKRKSLKLPEEEESSDEEETEKKEQESTPQDDKEAKPSENKEKSQLQQEPKSTGANVKNGQSQGGNEQSTLKSSANETDKKK